MKRVFAVAVLLLAVTASADECRRTFLNAEQAVTFDGQAIVGDFNEDGKPDFAAQGQFKSAVFLNRGGGVFEPVSVAETANPANGPIDVRDVNGDGHLDLVLQGTTFVSVMFGNGNATFTPPVFAGTMYPAWRIAFVDIDGDGVREWVTLQDTTFSIWKLTPAGTLQKVAEVARQFRTNNDALSVGDYDGDGRMDVMTGSKGPIEIFTQRPDHTFSEQAFVSTVAPGPYSIDVDGSGAEIVALPGNAGSPGSLKLIRIRAGQLSVRTLDVPGLPAFPGDLRMFDFDHDALPDLLFTTGTAIGIAWATAPGVFGSVSIFETLGTGLAIVDIDGDGIEDLVTQASAEGITVLYGKKQSRDLDAARIFTDGLRSDVPPIGVMADFDGDGDMDAAAVEESGTVSIVFGNGHGGFDPGPVKKFATTEVGDRRLAAADFDGDSKVDLAISGPEGAQLLFGDGGRAFGTTSLSLGAISVVAPLRMSAQGPPALIATQNGNVVALAISSGRSVVPQTIAALPNNGWVTVSPGGDVLVQSYSGLSIYTWNGASWNARPAAFVDGAATTADLDGDGITDLITYGPPEIFYGAPDGTFGAGSSLGATGFVIVADIDRDGRPDLVFVDGRLSSDAGIVGVRHNEGNRSFAPYSAALAGYATTNSFAVDTDHDGFPDVVMLTPSGVEVLRSVCATPRIRVAVTPARPLAGQRASFAAHVFSPAATNVTVTENGTAIASGLQQYGMLRWSSLPLTAGHHVYTVRYDDLYAGSSETTFELDVALPAAHRRAVR